MIRFVGIVAPRAMSDAFHDEHTVRAVDTSVDGPTRSRRPEL